MGDSKSSERPPPIEPKRPMAIRPYPRGFTAILPWHPPWEDSLGFGNFDFAGSSSANDKPNRQRLDLNLPPLVNSAPNSGGVMRNHTFFGGATTNKAFGKKPLIIDKYKAMEERDSKRLNELLLIQCDAKNKRVKKEAQVIKLEIEITFLENEINMLRLQLDGYNSHNNSAMFNLHKYKQSFLIGEREKLLQKVAGEKRILELYKANERLAKQMVEDHARVINIGASAKVSWPSMGASSQGQHTSILNQAQNRAQTPLMQIANDQQAQYGAGTSRGQIGNGPQIQNEAGTSSWQHVGISRMQVDIGQQPQNQNQAWMDHMRQHQAWMANRANGQSSTHPNYWSNVQLKPKGN